MHEILQLVLRYLRGAWRFRWWMLGIAWIVCLVGWIVVAQLPDQYKASARVYVDTRSVLASVIGARKNSDVKRRLFLMKQQLLSRPKLEQIMRMTDLDLRAKTAEDKEALLDDLKRKVRFSGGGKGENLYSIAYWDDSPELAKLVVKSMLTIFMESNLGESRKDEDQRTQFIEAQIADYEQRMREAEETQVRFKQRNLQFLTGAGGYYSRLRQSKAKVEKTELELKVAEDRVAVLRSQVAGEEPAFGFDASPAVRKAVKRKVLRVTPFDKRISAAETKLDDLLLRYTEKHPDVIAMRGVLQALKKRREKYLEEAPVAAPVAGAPTGQDGAVAARQNVDTNPVYQQMRLQLAKAEGDVAALKALLRGYQGQVKKMEDAVDRVLKVESERKTLTRDYGLLKRQHARFLARREAASLSRKADARAEAVQFRIINPPRVPLKPSGPDRVLLSSGVLGGGLVLGLVIAFVMSQVRPTFDERQVLTEKFGLPVLGSVNMVWTSDQIHARKMRNASFVFVMTGLFVVFGAVIALFQFDVDLVGKLTGVLKLS